MTIHDDIVNEVEHDVQGNEEQLELESETCCENGYLYAASQFRVNGKTPFQFEVVTEFQIGRASCRERV